MKYFCSLVLASIALVIPTHAQTRSAKDGGVLMDTGHDRYHADLQLTTSVVSQRYCTDGSLLFMLRFTFRNGGGESIILDKRSSIVPYYTVSRTAELAAAGKHKIEAHVLYGIGGELMTLQPIPDESQFITLRVGDSHAGEHGFRIPLEPKELKPGNYVLRVSVLTWHYAMASNIEWREKWHAKGYLWTNSITSQPMRFTIDKHPEFVQCS